jgi:hypothetical protein
MKRSYMPQTDYLRLFTDRLHTLGVRYVVVGSIAGMMYGEPRLTLDVDIVLELDPLAAPKLCDLFPIEEFYCPPVEVVAIEASRRQRGHVNLIHHDTGFKADIYFIGRQDELSRWALNHAVKSEIEGHVVSIAPLEYVIIGKLQYFQEGGSEKHLRDIRSMLKISGDRIDDDWLKTQISNLGLEAEWTKALETGG